MQYSVYAMHRRKDFYGEDAEEFKPERWETLRPGWVCRILIGTRIAVIGMHLLTTDI